MKEIVMTTLALHSVPSLPSLRHSFPLSWPRVAAYSGSFSLHLLIALLLLAPPLAVQIQRLVQETRIDGVIIDPPPVVKPEPPMPQPPVRIKKIVPAPPKPQIT